EATTEIIFGLQHMHNARRRKTCVMRKLHQRRLGIEACGPPPRRAITRRRAAQDGAGAAAGMHDIKRPGFLAGAAGQFSGTGDAGRSRITGGKAPSKLILDHLPLNLAGRFSRNAVTPSLKSSAAPAMRCD